MTKNRNISVRNNIKRAVMLVLIYVLPVNTVFASIMSSGKESPVNFIIYSNGGGIIGSSSYISRNVIGEGLSGECSGGNYITRFGFVVNTVTGVEEAAKTNLEEAHVFPSPFKPNSGGIFYSEYIIFKDLTEKATIRVFTVTGVPVKTIKKESADDNYRWDAKNDSGANLASGIYFFYITNPAGQTRSGKFSIIR